MPKINESNIPKKIRITAKISYDVFIVANFDDDKLGWCDPEARQILIRSGLGDREFLATFIHEVLHAIEFECKIALPHKTLDKLDSAIERVLRLNKWI